MVDARAAAWVCPGLATPMVTYVYNTIYTAALIHLLYTSLNCNFIYIATGIT